MVQSGLGMNIKSLRKTLTVIFSSWQKHNIVLLSKIIVRNFCVSYTFLFMDYNDIIFAVRPTWDQIVLFTNPGLL